MTDQMQGMRSDLAYVKALAREGRHAPLVGGRILVLAGIVWGAASLIMYLLFKGLLAGGGMVANTVWAVSALIFMGGLLLMKGRVRAAPGSHAINNRALSAVWKGCGIGIFALVVGIALVAYRLHTDVPMWLIAPAILMIYGIAWTVASAMSEVKWIRLMGPACFIGSVILSAMATLPEMFLAYALALFLLAALPGYLLMRAEPSDVV